MCLPKIKLVALIWTVRYCTVTDKKKPILNWNEILVFEG